MAEPEDNPYAAPSLPADALPAKQPQPISLINRIVSTALITIATILLWAAFAAAVSGEPLALGVYLVIAAILCAVGFSLRRHKLS